MKWTYVISQKLKAALALLTVLLMVLGTNMIDKQYFADLQDSFTAVYEDRLIAEIYLFDLSRNLQTKRKFLDEGAFEKASAHTLRNDSIHTIIAKYAATRLTPDEAKYFSDLQKDLDGLEALEQELIKSAPGDQTELRHAINAQFLKIWNDLEALSRVQFVEGRRLIEDSRRIIANSNLASRFELGIVIIIGIIIQALVFASKSETSKIKQNSSLN